MAQISPPSLRDLQIQIEGGDIHIRESASGFVFRNGGSCVSWKSRKQDSVAKSTTETEYTALSAAVSECIWLRRVLEELNYPCLESTTTFEGN